MSRTNPFPAQSLHSVMIPAPIPWHRRLSRDALRRADAIQAEQREDQGPWIRRLFRYQEWLMGEGYFGARSRARLPRDISSVIISGGSNGWESFRARWCAFSSRGNASPRPTILLSAGPSGELGP